MSPSRAPFACALALVSLGCGPARPARVSVEEATATVHWCIDTVTTSASGGDIDDAQPTIALVAEGAIAQPLEAGGGVGFCDTTPSATVGDVCGARPAGLVTRLVCGPDPHIDLVICFDAVRTNDRLQVWRHEYDVPSVDGEQPPPRLIGRTLAGGFDVPKEVSLRVTETKSRNVVEK
jgi:hypothetical protein